MFEKTARDAQLPVGTVTLVFTDIQGSTKLLQQLGKDYGDVLATHRRLVRAVIAAHGGMEVDTQGDAFFLAFPHAEDAVNAALECQASFRDHHWPQGKRLLVRMGIHTGTPILVEDHYVGLDVHRGARISAAAHGGQIVASSATVAALSADARVELDVTDLGLHRLKDLDDPEWLLQIDRLGSATDFPALRSLSPPTNVPQAAGQLVGRVRELADLTALLVDEGERLITITGPGGSGKTRVAAAVATRVINHFPYGAFFVDLSAISDSRRVAPSIADVLGLGIEAADDAVAVIGDHIGDRKMLIVLDNFEHVLESARSICDLVARCSELSVLVTSRSILSVRGEREYHIALLELPASGLYKDVIEADSALLFAQCATRVDPGFAITEMNCGAVARICEILDGLPLAIELAAARTKIFQPSELVTRLDDHLKLLAAPSTDAPVRHRALRATIDWSYDLLEPAQRTFFRDFSVFAGGATIESLEQVVGSEIEVFDSLTALLNNSLVRRREGSDGQLRFLMLQTILSYSRELLEGTGEADALRDRHAKWFTLKAEESEDAISNDYENMFAALEWLESRAEGDSRSATLGLRLAAALGSHWYKHGYARRGSEILANFIALEPETSPAARANALRHLGVLLDQLRKPAEAKDSLQRALELYREADDRSGEAACLNSLGIVARSAGDRADARSLLTQALELRRDLDDEEGESATLSNLGVVAVDEGDLADASRLFEASLSIDSRRGDAWGAACTASNLAVVRIEQGLSEQGRTLLVEAIATLAGLADMDGVASCLEAMAGADIHDGRYVKGVRMEGAASCIRAHYDLPPDPLEFGRMQAWLDRAREEMGVSAFEQSLAEGMAMTAEQAVAYSLDQIAPFS